MAGISAMFTPIAAFSYMILNLFDPPCLVAMATIYREMDSKKWAYLAIGYQIFLGYAMAFVCYNLGSWAFYGAAFGITQIISCVLIALALYFICRPAAPYEKETLASHQA